jgi:hypothetical protein
MHCTIVVAMGTHEFNGFRFVGFIPLWTQTTHAYNIVFSTVTVALNSL